VIEIEGRQILTELHEKVDPRHTAILVIDMQKDFTTPGCFWDSLGQDVSEAGALADRLLDFLEVARGHGVRIVHVSANYDPEYMNEPMHERLHRHGVGRYCQSGTRGIEFHDGLEPRPGESIVVKHRFDAFFDTELHLLLQAAGVKTVITTGVAVHGCVDSTTRHAYFLGYYTVFGEDLTGGAPADVHWMTLDSMRLMFGVTATADEIVAAWRQVEGDRQGRTPRPRATAVSA
jgi:ureidoacrylate peracid hydrolase